MVREGWIAPGPPLSLVDHPFPRYTVALTNDFGHARNRDVQAVRELAACPLLPAWWQRLVVRRAKGNEW